MIKEETLIFQRGEKQVKTLERQNCEGHALTGE